MSHKINFAFDFFPVSVVNPLKQVDYDSYCEPNLMHHRVHRDITRRNGAQVYVEENHGCENTNGRYEEEGGKPTPK